MLLPGINAVGETQGVDAEKYSTLVGNPKWKSEVICQTTPLDSNPKGQCNGPQVQAV
jgi:hypothetical protein